MIKSWKSEILSSKHEGEDIFGEFIKIKENWQQSYVYTRNFLQKLLYGKSGINILSSVKKRLVTL